MSLSVFVWMNHIICIDTEPRLALKLYHRQGTFFLVHQSLNFVRLAFWCSSGLHPLLSFPLDSQGGIPISNLSLMNAQGRIPVNNPYSTGCLRGIPVAKLSPLDAQGLYQSPIFPPLDAQEGIPVANLSPLDA